MTANEMLQYYREHRMTVDEAVKLVNSGDLIIDGHGHGRSDIFGPALMARADELKDVRLTTGYNLGQSLHCDPQYEGHFKHVSIFNIAQTRQAHWEGRADFAAGHFSQLERIFTSWKPRVLFTQVTPPNENGYVSMGVSVDFTRAMMDVCPIVIAQVNRNMPWVDGDAVVPVTAITAFVEADTELPELGSTGIMKLMQKGVIDNSMKTLDRGKVVCTLMGGTKEFYKFVDHNDDFLMRRSSYVLNPAVICQQKNMVAMNSAIEIDLLGQANSEMIAGKQFSGVGGQVDFLRGAMMAEGGKSILCMPSTASKGTKSRIVAQLPAGAVVTASRYDVMYVVTEYGVADLWGKNNDERAKQLIEIAHPDFRAQLEKDFWEKIHKVV